MVERAVVELVAVAGEVGTSVCGVTVELGADGDKRNDRMTSSLRPPTVGTHNNRLVGGGRDGGGGS